MDQTLALCLWTAALPASSVKSWTHSVHQSWGVSYLPVPQALPSAFLPIQRVGPPWAEF